MINDANTLSESILSADIVIVGSGAAGIPLALEFEHSATSVLVIEAGSFKAEKETQALYKGLVRDTKLHNPADTFRIRMWGGSTTLWGGRCMPFDDIDFAQRDYLPYSGWPIGINQLLPYYPKANAYLEAGEYRYRDHEALASNTPPLFAGFKSETLLTDGLERFSCPTDLGKRYVHRFAKSENIHVLQHANLTHIELSPNGESVEYLVIKTLKGKTLTIKGKRFVLAMGGIEIARLLLASNNIQPKGIGNQHDLVGRYYMCHIAGNVGNLTINGDTKQVRHGYEISLEGIYCRRRLQLSPETQAQLKVTNMVARLHFPKITDPRHRSGILSGLFIAKNFISYEYATRLKDGSSRGLIDYLKHFRNILLDPIDTLAFLWHWLNKRTLAERKFPSVILRNKTNLFSLEVHAEQIPNPNSRILLSDEKDSLGVPKVLIDWQYTTNDIEMVRSSLHKMADEIKTSGIGEFTFDETTFETELMRFGAYGGHHIGTTRMSEHPTTGVVDTNCKVFGVNNLYIASSAVFPTSSQANPTLTITAMALRLAKHLKEASV